MSKKIGSLGLFLIVFLWPAAALAQQVTVKPFEVERSTLLDDLKELKAANPKMKPEELAAAANELLGQKGLNFDVRFDAATCQKIAQAIAARKDKNEPLNLRTALKSPVGETATLLLPEVGFATGACAACYVSIPILEATPSEFVTIVEGRNLKFFLPSNFVLYEAALVEAKDLSTVKRRWKLPVRARPLSISYDGNVLYLAFAEPELAELVLAVFGEGVYQIAPRRELDEGVKATPVKDFPKDATDPGRAVLKFEHGDASHFVRYSADCPS